MTGWYCDRKNTTKKWSLRRTDSLVLVLFLVAYKSSIVNMVLCQKTDVRVLSRRGASRFSVCFFPYPSLSSSNIRAE